MHRIIVILILSILLIPSFAQEMTVKSFTEKTSDLSASTQIRKDNNGTPCALVKVQLAATGAQFEPNVIGTVTYYSPIYWVYLPAGSKHLKVKHPNSLPIDVVFDSYGVHNLEAKKTYLLDLRVPDGFSAPRVETSQYLIFNIEPKYATITVNDEVWPTIDGVARKFVPLGIYDYRVEADLYQSQTGRVEVHDSNNRTQVSVALQSEFGYLSIPNEGNLDDATIYIDSKVVGKAPLAFQKVATGQHTIKAVKNLYQSKEQVIEIQNGQALSVVPILNADYSTVTLMVDNNAEIWINGELQGNGSWTGDLAAGDYVFEARLEHHRSVIVSKHISSDSIRQTIAMEAPTPIYGSLHVSSIPDSATVYIDEQLVGNTPLSVQQCLIGEHNVRISKKDYGDYRSDVMILEDSMMVVEGALRDLVNVAITCNVVEAQLFVDGQAASPDSGVVRMDMGVHKILMMAEGYDNYIDTIEVTQDRQMFHFEMTANKEEKLTFMVNEVAFTMIPVQGGSFIMGATPEQLKSDKDEHPVHQVTLSDYYIGETEVTQALWKAVMGVNPSEVKDSRLPVDRVSWEDCQMFVERLNALTGKSFRLPTEAEWEFAARGGNHSCGYQYSGSNRLSDVAWYGGNSCNANHFVKTKNPNELGVYDMSGNVWEWCQDWKAAYSNQAETNPTGASSGISRVIRGGSWFNNAVDCRTANRNFDTPNSRYVYLGLRLAL